MPAPTGPHVHDMALHVAQSAQMEQSSTLTIVPPTHDVPSHEQPATANWLHTVASGQRLQSVVADGVPVHASRRHVLPAESHVHPNEVQVAWSVYELHVPHAHPVA